MITLKKVTKAYNQKCILDIDNINFNSDLSVILGPSGSGKTTLLNILGTITEFDTGIYKCDETSKQYTKRIDNRFSIIRF